MKRVLVAAGLYLAMAALGHAREQAGAISCRCRADCWCRRRGLRVLRWVLPFGHR